MENEKFEALQTANEYLDKLKNGISKVINLLEEEKEGEACNYLADITEGIDWISQVVTLTADIQKEKIELGDINEKLTEAVEALENEDYNLLGDIFKYEILPILENMHKQVKVCILN
jgi:flagellin-specific chaperone FliS